MGTTGSGTSKATGGSNSKTITQANLPNIKLKVDSFSATISPHYHHEGHACWEDDPNSYGKDRTGDAGSAAFRETTKTIRYRTSTAGGGSTSTVTPQTNSLGSGQALDITPSYYTTHIWLRTS